MTVDPNLTQHLLTINRSFNDLPDYSSTYKCANVPKQGFISYYDYKENKVYKRKYYVSFNSQIDVTTLINEFEFIKNKMDFKAVVYAYIEFRYGLSMDQYLKTLVETSLGSEHVILGLLIAMRQIGTKVCLLLSKKTKPLYRDYPEYLEYRHLYAEYEDTSCIEDEIFLIFGVKPYDSYKFGLSKENKVSEVNKKLSTNKATTMAYKDFCEMVFDDMGVHEPKLFNYMFNLKYTTVLLKNLVDRKNNKHRRIVAPEVFRTLLAVRPFFKYVEDTSVLSSSPDLKKPRETYRTFKGVASFKKIRQENTSRAFKISRSQSQLLSLDVDPLMEKTVVSYPGLKDLYYLSSLAENYLKCNYNTTIQYTDRSSPLAKYSAEVKNTARGLVSAGINAFPLKVWHAYFDYLKDMNLHIVSDPRGEKKSIESLRLLTFLRLSDELKITLYKNVLDYSSKVGLDSVDSFGFSSDCLLLEFNTDLLKAAQVLVSMAIQYDDSSTKTYGIRQVPSNHIQKHYLLLKEKKEVNALHRPFFKNIKKIKTIDWLKVKNGLMKRMPYVFSYISPEFLALIGSHHDQAEIFISRDFYRCYSPKMFSSSLCYKFKKNIKFGYYSTSLSKFKNTPKTPGYYTWLNLKSKDEGGEVTAFNFIRGESFLEDNITTATYTDTHAKKIQKGYRTRKLIESRTAILLRVFSEIQTSTLDGNQNLRLLKFKLFLEKNIEELKASLETRKSRLKKKDQAMVFNKEYALVCAEVTLRLRHTANSTLVKILPPDELKQLDMKLVSQDLKDVYYPLIKSHAFTNSWLNAKTYMRDNVITDRDLTDEEKNEISTNSLFMYRDTWERSFEDLLIKCLNIKCSLDTMLNHFNAYITDGEKKKYILEASKEAAPEAMVHRKLKKALGGNTVVYEDMFSQVADIFRKVVLSQPATTYENYTKAREGYLELLAEYNSKDPEHRGNRPEFDLEPGVNFEMVTHFTRFIDMAIEEYDNGLSINKNVDVSKLKSYFNTVGSHIDTSSLEVLGCTYEFYQIKYEAWIKRKRRIADKRKAKLHGCAETRKAHNLAQLRAYHKRKGNDEAYAKTFL